MAAKDQHITTPPDSPNLPENISSAPTHTDPAAALAQLWPRLDARDREVA